ncbi:T5orf172 domain-containing protein [Aspergillus pseudotamarii]|uniref:T5orf172 domain-containing protein n=1 Tax=Aspergillus pseudotamarii TaxID=132259 RepID=A0A5N6T1K6_ASPPS|nr:T5orf172 domain-containing protein [Aspergillus pseudotamarii]KAE8140183.1 T5orf172 domain-containing protein [Aspergillus pseudotamarii]
MSVSTFVHFNYTALEELKVNKKCVAEVVKGGSIKRCGQWILTDSFCTLRVLYENNQDTSRNELPLREIAKLCLCKTHRKEPTNISRAVEQWTREISDPSCPPNEALPDTNPPLTPPNRNDGRRRSTVSPGRFKAYSRHGSPQKVNERIIEVLNQPKKIKPETGFVYVFAAANTPNRFKIGYTKKPKDRFRVWSKCYPDLIVHILIECTDAHKVEDLVHAEFDLQRQEHICEICKSKPVHHDEWFEKGLEDIRPVVNGWVAFVDLAYLDDGGIKPEYQSLAPALAVDEGRWQKWIQGELNRNKIAASAAPELVEDLTDSGTSESPATPKTDSSGASKAPPSPILLPIPGALPTVEEHVGSLPSARENAVSPKPLDGKAPKGEEDKVTLLGLARGIISMIASVSG